MFLSTCIFDSAVGTKYSSEYLLTLSKSNYLKRMECLNQSQPCTFHNTRLFCVWRIRTIYWWRLSSDERNSHYSKYFIKFRKALIFWIMIYTHTQQKTAKFLCNSNLVNFVGSAVRDITRIHLRENAMRRPMIVYKLMNQPNSVKYLVNYHVKLVIHKILIFA